MRKLSKRHKAALISELAMELRTGLELTEMEEFLVANEEFTKSDASEFVWHYEEFISKISDEIENIVATSIEEELD